MDLPTTTVSLLAAAPILIYFLLPILLRSIGSVAGTYLCKKTEGRHTHLLELAGSNKKKDETLNKDSSDGWGTVDAQSLRGTDSQGSPLPSNKDWTGIVGFFHPFCNAGGGGERVLWAAIRATQKQWPYAICVVYTGDRDLKKHEMVHRVKTRFNIDLHPDTLFFLHLSTRHLVLASTWPHFTLLGQSLGSMVLAWDAFGQLVPDLFIDTMGYAFALGLSKFLFPSVPTAAYVHYPTISTDMLESLDPKSTVGSQGVNAGQGVGARGVVKRAYWRLFAALYARVGSTADVVMTNSSWTQAHIQQIWGPRRVIRSRTHPIAVVYPPCAVEELESTVEVSAASEARREEIILYIAQFRPEKNHKLILGAFAELRKREIPALRDARLVLVGSVRDDSDSKRVYELRLLTNELGIRNHVDFRLDVPWPDILDWLRRASVGANGMWNEHFGIGVVEYQAAGLISVVHDSGGPKLDIVVDVDGEPTGTFGTFFFFFFFFFFSCYHATTATEFADGFEKALSIKDPLAMRQRARRSAQRFGEEEFARRWQAQMEVLIGMA
ncbi:family 4 glycosyltransferase [Sodiomyces alkalinus F11]|uniref:GDP-Man:Man(3)GlcNAc(2)-PP-Dol alpha-1,2-mannosyltransferase n=1 Tax=Sodiomyces alkalinus (strain CBS 110278 / VKM F-3762 / F11) TaxID=1314773 RepID=A0A3N2QA40_SODAK|nr:family 4 glycosyltransferase [Sodiomyces alkalinus F11]ROT43587.1 family 4 glycosyltransferase [Sodiomyces alkalinus F11]